jgi:acetyl esterase/lipase
MKTILNKLFVRYSPLVTLLLGLTGIFSVTGLFLAIWIVIPAPIAPLLPLGVGAAEVSPWLIGLNSIATLLALTILSAKPLSRLLLVISLAALGLSALPLAQFSATNQRAAIAMEMGLGKNYLADISQSGMRPAPFVLLDAFRGIPAQQIRRSQDIPVAHPDGVSLTLNVYRPNQTGKNPTIIMIYGGAWRSGDPSANEQFSEYMAARGYTVVTIDYRHMPRYKFPTQIDDIKTALTFIQQHANEYDIDTHKIVRYYSPVDLTVGYTDPPSPDPLDTRSILRSFLGGTPQEFPDLYRQASPYNYVRAGLPSTLLIYGKRDHIVQSKYGRLLHEKLNNNRNTSVFIEIPWAEHAFDAVFNGVSNQLALYYTERFLAWVLR